MEPMGAFPDGEWGFSRMFSTEELDFGPEFFGQSHFSLQHDEGSHFADLSAFCSNIAEANVSMAGFDESAFYSWNTLNSNLDFIPQENSKTSNSNSSSVSIPSSSHETFFFTGHSDHIPEANDVSAVSMDICMMDQKNSCPFVSQFPDIAMAESARINIEDIGSDETGSVHNGQQAVNAAAAMQLQLKRKLFITESSKANPTDRSKKKPRTPGTAQKGKKNVQPNKNQKSTTNSNDEEESNAKPHGQSSSCYSSEDDNVSQDSNGGVTSESKVPEALNSNGKARASRGSATDPQSLYARKRRERINERLRILQNLVPNGTKVDISTMLEEAVHYVKFLQLQIKLLSSDDLWMYAPIAYNGVDIGLSQKLSILL